jgi:hypothetical protein
MHLHDITKPVAGGSQGQAGVLWACLSQSRYNPVREKSSDGGGLIAARCCMRLARSWLQSITMCVGVVMFATRDLQQAAQYPTGGRPGTRGGREQGKQPAASSSLVPAYWHGKRELQHLSPAEAST